MKKLSVTKNAIAKRAKRAAAKIQAIELQTIEPVTTLEIVKTEIAENKDAEANLETVKRDDVLSSAQTGDEKAIEIVAKMPIAKQTIANELTTSVPTWNNRDLIEIKLRENSNVLNRFEYVPASLTVGGFETDYKILQCSDTGAIVGKPFAESYGLVNNADFIAIIETICIVLEKMGLKYQISTTGTLQNRERSFISLKIEHGNETIIDGREFKMFLNCLNSIPSNSGCTVTFANNSFCVCCANTFAHVLQGKDGSKFHAAIKHTKNVKAVLEDVPILVEAYFSGNEKLFANLRHFATFPVGLVDAENFFAAFIGRTLKGDLTDKSELKTRSANIIDKLSNLFVRGKGNKGETALDVFQAVTEYYTHFSAGESDDKNKQFNSSENGDGYFSKGEFYSWLVKYTQSKNSFNAIARVGETLLVNYRNRPAKA